MGFMDKKKRTIKKEEIAVPIPVPKAEKEEEKHKWVVVKELPTQIVRETVQKEGTILHFITIEEALTEVINQ